MAQSVKGLSYRNRNLGSDLQHAHIDCNFIAGGRMRMQSPVRSVGDFWAL